MQARVAIPLIREDHVAWSIIACPESDYWPERLERTHRRVAGPPIEVDGQAYSLFAVHCGSQDITAWSAELDDELLARQPRSAPVGKDRFRTWQRAEFDQEVRQTLRAWRRPDRFADSALRAQPGDRRNRLRGRRDWRAPGGHGRARDPRPGSPAGEVPPRPGRHLRQRGGSGSASAAWARSGGCAHPGSRRRAPEPAVQHLPPAPEPGLDELRTLLWKAENHGLRLLTGMADWARGHGLRLLTGMAD